MKLLSNYSFDYPIALDFEDGDLFALKLSKEQYSAIVDAFMSVLERLTITLCCIPTLTLSETG